MRRQLMRRECPEGSFSHEKDEGKLIVAGPRPAEAYGILYRQEARLPRRLELNTFFVRPNKIDS